MIDSDKMPFLTENDVIERLRFRNLVDEERNYDETDIAIVESYLSEMPEIRHVDVFTYVGGKWVINIELRKPIARIFNPGGSTCYLDSDGTLMPWSPNYTARVIAVNGNIHETDLSKNVAEIMNNDSLKTIETLDDLYAISAYVCSDEFLSAQITQIYINRFKEFELIPRVGDQRILFGDADHVVGKFEKLKYFYSEGMSRAGWENYDTINLMFKNQVVCSKRN
jgi:cell division protein FtsQ